MGSGPPRLGPVGVDALEEEELDAFGADTADVAEADGRRPASLAPQAQSAPTSPTLMSLGPRLTLLRTSAGVRARPGQLDSCTLVCSRPSKRSIVGFESTTVRKHTGRFQMRTSDAIAACE
jgi:hypothetical protein